MGQLSPAFHIPCNCMSYAPKPMKPRTPSVHLLRMPVKILDDTSLHMQNLLHRLLCKRNPPGMRRGSTLCFTCHTDHSQLWLAPVCCNARMLRKTLVYHHYQTPLPTPSRACECQLPRGCQGEALKDLNRCRSGSSSLGSGRFPGRSGSLLCCPAHRQAMGCRVAHRCR